MTHSNINYHFLAPHKLFSFIFSIIIRKINIEQYYFKCVNTSLVIDSLTKNEQHFITYQISGKLSSGFTCTLSHKTMFDYIIILPPRRSLKKYCFSA